MEESNQKSCQCEEASCACAEAKVERCSCGDDCNCGSICNCNCNRAGGCDCSDPK